jgi:hypothetical protein
MHIMRPPRDGVVQLLIGQLREGEREFVVASVVHDRLGALGGEDGEPQPVLDHGVPVALAVAVEGPPDERRLRPEGQGDRLKGWSTEPMGVDLVTFPTSEVGEYWPLVRP